MSVKDIASQSIVIFEARYIQHDWKDKCLILAFVIPQQIKEVIATDMRN